MPKTKDQSLSLLFASFPPMVGDRALQLEAYMTAVAPFDEADVAEAVNRFLTGGVEWHNRSFAPSAALLGGEIRKVQDWRLDSIERSNRLTPRLAPPPIEHSPEERARARAMVQGFVENVGAIHLLETTEDAKRSRERWERANSLFQPAMDETSMMQRLLGYSVGSPESEENAA